MDYYAFPLNLLSEIKARWNQNVTIQPSELPNDQTLKRLLEICYHASLRTVELRPVHCVLAYARRDFLPAETKLHLSEPVVLTEREIVRLSPVADIRRTLIGCEEINGELRIWGVFEHLTRMTQTEEGDYGEATLEKEQHLPECLTIAIIRPGELNIKRGHRRLVRLREGRMVFRRENPLRDPDDPLGQHLRMLVSDLQRSLNTAAPRPPERDGEHSLLTIYTSTIARVLQRIQDRREGGSIVLAPHPFTSEAAQVTYTIANSTGLLDQILAHHQALQDMHQPLTVTSKADGELQHCRAQATLRHTWDQLSRGINQISLLASVDGAVSLDHELRINGFGVRFPLLLPIGATIVDVITGIENSCDQWGLRHQAIFSTCYCDDRVIGLIVSQDGTAKAVKRIGDRLLLWNGILD